MGSFRLLAALSQARGGDTHRSYLREIEIWQYRALFPAARSVLVPNLLRKQTSQFEGNRARGKAKY